MKKSVDDTLGGSFHGCSFAQRSSFCRNQRMDCLEVARFFWAVAVSCTIQLIDHFAAQRWTTSGGIYAVLTKQGSQVCMHREFLSGAVCCRSSGSPKAPTKYPSVSGKASSMSLALPRSRILLLVQLLGRFDLCFTFLFLQRDASNSLIMQFSGPACILMAKTLDF